MRLLLPAPLMSANDDDEDDSLEAAEKRDGRTGRLIMFFIINGPTTLLTAGLWIRLSARSAHGGAMANDSWLKMAFAVWLVGLIGSTIALFKK